MEKPFLLFDGENTKFRDYIHPNLKLKFKDKNQIEFINTGKPIPKNAMLMSLNLLPETMDEKLLKRWFEFKKKFNLGFMLDEDLFLSYLSLIDENHQTPNVNSFMCEQFIVVYATSIIEKNEALSQITENPIFTDFNNYEIYINMSQDKRLFNDSKKYIQWDKYRKYFKFGNLTSQDVQRVTNELKESGIYDDLKFLHFERILMFILMDIEENEGKKEGQIYKNFIFQWINNSTDTREIQRKTIEPYGKSEIFMHDILNYKVWKDFEILNLAKILHDMKNISYMDEYMKYQAELFRTGGIVFNECYRVLASLSKRNKPELENLEFGYYFLLSVMNPEYNEEIWNKLFDKFFDLMVENKLLDISFNTLVNLKKTGSINGKITRKLKRILEKYKDNEMVENFFINSEFFLPKQQFEPQPQRNLTTVIKKISVMETSTTSTTISPIDENLFDENILNESSDSDFVDEVEMSELSWSIDQWYNFIHSKKDYWDKKELQKWSDLFDIWWSMKEKINQPSNFYERSAEIFEMLKQISFTNSPTDYPTISPTRTPTTSQNIMKQEIEIEKDIVTQENEAKNRLKEEFETQVVTQLNNLKDNIEIVNIMIKENERILMPISKKINKLLDEVRNKMNQFKEITSFTTLTKPKRK